MRCWIGAVSIAGLLSAAGSLWAQTEPLVYGTSTCVKVVPGKAAEFERFVAEVTRKLMQVSIDEGGLVRWSMSRAVAPTGEEARCDYVALSVYKGTPPPPLDEAAAALFFKKAGLNMSVADFNARRLPLARTVRTYRLVRYAGFGAFEKGDYWQANLMKPKPGKGAEFRDFERKVWLPMAEEAAKAGHSRKSWAAWYVQYPMGTGEPFDDVTTDFFRSWDSIWKPEGFTKDLLAKYAGGKSAAELGQQMNSLRDLTHRELYVVIELLRAAAAGKP